MNNKIFSVAAFFGMTAIIFGAFGAHALKKVLLPEHLISFETAVKYQMYHALFLLFLGLQNQLDEKSKKLIYYFVVLGVILFSGSIYLLSTGSISGINFKPFGFVTPIGGVFLILSWGVLFWNYLFKKS
ncbi:uncharacterized membrane protein YgdD (TMEM256/DUF423 family) [Flavobacterium croceum DSM 17960]|uniref:Uncharacterized membrane protein YgdD (TMEM256/DUF423 family) n=1 Tax=Flavobacterium croceum DSM 17960 TaxID=1121886 RepID=A0A2S4N6F2_9FLAO|nr:DUF423 domain-containing protein [Flavobacterium croceum]POS01286.1 uncharacterized membrane protein YgdD (TMEM256/DUF423 family) [Flavobacterium croceum DSM 17960]